MSIRTRVLCVALTAALAFPLTVRAQPPDLPAAGVEMGAAALELHTAAQDSLAGTPGGDALIRDLQSFRTAVDEFRNAMDVGRPPPDVGRRFARVADIGRRVQNDLRSLPGMPPYMARRAARFDRAFDNLSRMMGGY
jgi:hypothetical protein